ncbi:MAG: glycogen debranching enzyme, partial [Kitasatospora sp.]|nr:glycogen debranching enzyme [Kitasatospora sp.]
DDNRSWNCGVEGPAGNPEITRVRARQKRNFLVSLLCSQGMPMLLAGDELGRTQGGNNNAYCQDNEISWLGWELSPEDREMLGFVRAIAGLRRAHRVFRRRTFFRGRPAGAAPGSPADVVWFTPSGQEMTEPDWHAPGGDCLAVFLNGADAATATDPEAGDLAGAGLAGDSFLLLFNPRGEPVTFSLPDARFAAGWEVVLDTGLPPGDATASGAAPAVDGAGEISPAAKAEVADRSVLVLRAARRVQGDPGP